MGHWSNYAPGTGFGWRYRVCKICKKVWRNNGERSLIHNGRKAKRWQ